MADIIKDLAPLIGRINQTMVTLISQDEEVVSRISGYSFEGGGKRLRPLMFCLMAEAMGLSLTQDKLETSAAFEFLHMATLLHDDIIDAAEVRRGRAAAHLIYGVPEAILAGDYLLAKAALLGAATNNMACVRIFSQVVGTLSLGELVQLDSRRRLHLTEEEYFTIIYRKTAVLMEGAVWIAAILAGAEGEALKVAISYGRQVGLAFQIMDDILDYQGEASVFGKPVGHDLDEGKVTLPFIRARDSLSERERDQLLSLASLAHISPASHGEIRQLVNSAGGLVAARLKAEELAKGAGEALAVLPDSTARRQLESLAAYAVARNF